MKKLTTVVILISTMFGASANASVDMADVKTLFKDDAQGFYGQIKLICLAEGDEVTGTISAIVTAASADRSFSVLTNGIKFAHIGPSFVNKCGRYMNQDEKEVLTALVNFANGLIGEDSDS